MAWTALLGLLLLQSPVAATSGCERCHGELAGTPLGEPVELFQADVHRQAGLSCASCHGGDPSADEMGQAKDLSKGYLGAPSFADIPGFCGSCHSSADFMKQYNPSLRIDQVAEYQTSRHGELAAQGDRQVATCTSCHSVHDIRPVSDPTSPVYPLKVADTCGRCHANFAKMEPYQLPSDQVTLYKASVHGAALYEKRDLSAPTCNDCHGNHGAQPPGISSVANVCGHCHGTQRELFNSSPHSDMFMILELKGCTTCHGNHGVSVADESLLMGDATVCSACHEADAGSETAQEMGKRILELRHRIEAAQELLSQAEEAGVEVSQPIFDLREGGEQVILARHEVHSLDLDALTAAVDEGMKIADAAHSSGVKAFEELRFRRRGLYVSLVVILSVIAALVLWIKAIEKED